MDLVKESIRIHRNERIDSIQVWDRGRLVFYSYTYLYLSRYGDWRPLVRWDNFEKNPHVDKYDENNALLESKTCGEKGLEEVIKLATIFRRNLLAMDLGVL
ncbi:MAG: hypothetical protein QCI38_00180 [Candidatus Thermoplasmatota archaeon]|nr:hypothetical protein [Candidatus Thermoplasmatota archaeon]